MATSTHTEQPQMVALDAIELGDNARTELDREHVENLSRSIRLRGLLSPLTLKPIGENRFRLVAGFHRYAACQLAELTEAPGHVRDQDGESADHAAENVLRKALSPLEEARAIQAMFDQGYTPKGAGEALGMSAAKVTARAKILRLPDGLQQLIGVGEIPVGAVEVLLSIQQASGKLCDLLGEVLAEAVEQGSSGWGDQLARDPGYVIGRVLAHRPGGVFATYLTSVDRGDVEQLRLGKKTAGLLEQAEQLHRKLDRYAYGPPRIAFSEADVDQARAAGVLLELGRQPIIIDKPLYRDLCKQAIARAVDELQARLDGQAEQRQLERTETRQRERTAFEQADLDHRAHLRELTAQAHGVNLDLGCALLDGLATVDPTDMTVARFFAYGVLGPDTQHFLGGGDAAARTVAANGLRLILEEHRSTETPTRKNGTPGKTKVTYGEVEDAQKWLWRFVNGAKTAGELYGRVLTVFAAQHYAHQQVLPQSQRRPSAAPRSKDDRARKALERACKAVLPGSYKQLQRALDRAARDHIERLEQLRNATSNENGSGGAEEGDETVGDDVVLDDDALEGTANK